MNSIAACWNTTRSIWPVNETRDKLLTEGRHDAAVPVLFMRLQDGRLWQAPAARPLELNALHQLPAPPADFTGRTADLVAILNDIQQGAVISGLRGMGGIGKTALALVIADRLKAQYPDAQFFINLQGASDHPLSPRDALQAVIRAYHPTAQLPDDATQLAALYRSVLDGQRASSCWMMLETPSKSRAYCRLHLACCSSPRGTRSRCRA